MNPEELHAKYEALRGEIRAIYLQGPSPRNDRRLEKLEHEWSMVLRDGIQPNHPSNAMGRRGKINVGPNLIVGPWRKRS